MKSSFVSTAPPTAASSAASPDAATRPAITPSHGRQATARPRRNRPDLLTGAVFGGVAVLAASAIVLAGFNVTADDAPGPPALSSTWGQFQLAGGRPARQTRIRIVPGDRIRWDATTELTQRDDATTRTTAVTATGTTADEISGSGELGLRTARQIAAAAQATRPQPSRVIGTAVAEPDTEPWKIPARDLAGLAPNSSALLGAADAAITRTLGMLPADPGDRDLARAVVLSSLLRSPATFLLQRNAALATIMTLSAVRPDGRRVVRVNGNATDALGRSGAAVTLETVPGGTPLPEGSDVRLIVDITSGLALSVESHHRSAGATPTVLDLMLYE